MIKAPKILAVAFESWAGVARLPRALKNAGFNVAILCKPNAFLTHTHFRDRLFLFPEANRGSSYLERLREVIRQWPPTLVMPMDETAAVLLSRVFEKIIAGNSDKDLADLLVRSFGNPAALREAVSKRLTMEAAKSAGVDIPNSEVVRTTEEIIAFGKKHNFPVVLKHSSSSSGLQVFICHNDQEIVSTWERMHRHKSWKRRFYRWRDGLRGKVLNKSWRGTDQSITVSQFIRGTTATTMAAAFEGRMLAALSAYKIETYPGPTGPSSVIRIIHNEKMSQMTKAMIQHWRLTGMVGFDFVVDELERPWLLECNPRPTAIGHLGPHVGIDLCGALFQALISGTPIPLKASSKELVVAHFPQESFRDPNSPHLKTAFHDIPSDDPELLNCLQQTLLNRPAAN